MVKLKFWRLALTLYHAICTISAYTHWVVTENGLIQPLLDSPFQMRLPNDLMAFLEQEKRLVEIDSLYHNLVSRKFVIDEASLERPQDIASKLYMTNDNCLKSGVAMGEIDLYMSVAADGSDRDGIKLVDFFADNSLRNAEGSDIPDCMKLTPLPFSMFAFEHLKAMIDRHNLSLSAEHSLSEWLLPGTSVTSFGHQVAEGLRFNSSSWLHYNLAAIFWRIKGEALRAIECGRRAVHYAPREYRDVPLLNLASIFHQTKNPNEAVIILHAAIDHAPRQPANHFALGNAYAVLEEYNRSVAYYDNCLKLMPNFKQARINKYLVLCHEKYVNELMELYDAIQAKQTELRDFQSQHEKWLRLEEKAMREQAPLEARDLEDIGGGPQTCIQQPSDEVGGDPALSCRSSSFPHMYGAFESRNEKFNPFNIMHSIQVLLQNVEAETKKLSVQIARTEKFHLMKGERDIDFSTISTKKISGQAPDSSEYDDEVEETPLPTLGLYFNEAIDDTDHGLDLSLNPPKYPPTFKISRIKQEFDKNSNWPSRDECDEWAPALSQRVDRKGEAMEHLPIYLPIENKGYNISMILSDNIGVPLHEEHPLPWYPPLCCSAPQSAVKQNYLPSALITNTKPLPTYPPNNLLRNILISYVTSTQVDNSKNIQEAEIGQRILTAINKRVAPKWLLYTLSSLYWRVRGNTQNCLDCLLCGLTSAVTSPNRDTLLVSLGALLNHLGYVDESLKAAEEAFMVNKNEPATNFLMSLLHMSKKKSFGQMYYMRQVVRIESQFMDGWGLSLLQAWNCHSKFGNKPKAVGEQETAKTELPEMCSDAPPTEMTPSDALTVNLDGGVVGRGMICTAGGQSCQPANIHCYKAGTHSDLGEEYLPFDLVSDTDDEDSMSEDILFHSLLSKISTIDDNVLSNKELESLVYFKSEGSSDMKDTEPKTRFMNLKNAETIRIKSSSPAPEKVTPEKTCSPTSDGTTKAPLTLNLRLKSVNLKDVNGDSYNKDNGQTKSNHKHFQIHLAPTDKDIGEGDSELGNLIVSVGPPDSAMADTLHVYDKSVSFHLSSETCSHLSRPDWIKSPSLWNAFAQRDFYPSSELLSVIKFPVTDIKLRPQCSAPRGDLVELAGAAEFPPLPHQPASSLLPILRRLTGDHHSTLNILAAKIAEALRHNTSSWLLHILAGIYWRIEGNSDMLVSCLRQSLHLAPEKHKDVPLLALASVLHWIGYTDDALKLAYLAYQKRPDFPVNPYHLGLIHADLGEYEQSIHMFRKAIALDRSFSVAKSCLQDILCLLLFGNNGVLRDNLTVEEIFH